MEDGTMKRLYEKPSMKVYELQISASLLQNSDVDGDNPFEWGNPTDDR
jgi:hypothetical protein